MTYIKSFKELDKSDAHTAGGKGASLGEMLNAGIAVPDGFVVLADSFESFIKRTGLVEEISAILESVNIKETHTIDSASEKIRGLILNKEMPEDIKLEITGSLASLNVQCVAVRSSATAEDGADHAWAGQLESYLNVTKQDVLKRAQECWASLFTPRAIFYRFEKGLDTLKISVAIVIQKMVSSEKSGIAFSVHPITEDENQLIIEAGYGLGEAVVSGSITPDRYVVSKVPRNIVNIAANHQNRGLFAIASGGSEWVNLEDGRANTQVLSEKEIMELSELVILIENHYGFPSDIEWAFENGRFYILQSRPITTLEVKPS